MEDEQWNDPHARAVGMLLNGDSIELGRRGEDQRDSTFLVLLNGSADDVPFTLPGGEWGQAWSVAVDTDAGFVTDDQGTGDEVLDAGTVIPVPPQSIAVLRCRG